MEKLPQGLPRFQARWEISIRTRQAQAVGRYIQRSQTIRSFPRLKTVLIKPNIFLGLTRAILQCPALKKVFSKIISAVIQRKKSKSLTKSIFWLCLTSTKTLLETIWRRCKVNIKTDFFSVIINYWCKMLKKSEKFWWLKYC